MIILIMLINSSNSYPSLDGSRASFCLHDLCYYMSEIVRVTSSICFLYKSSLNDSFSSSYMVLCSFNLYITYIGINGTEKRVERV